MSDERNCGDCKFCVFKDEGYSNYTVENTVFICAESKHPEAPFDRFYGEDKRLEYATKCDAFEAGQNIELDVDGEELDTLTGERKDIAEKALAL